MLHRRCNSILLPSGTSDLSESSNSNFLFGRQSPFRWIGPLWWRLVHFNDLFLDCFTLEISMKKPLERKRLVASSTFYRPSCSIWHLQAPGHCNFVWGTAKRVNSTRAFRHPSLEPSDTHSMEIVRHHSQLLNPLFFQCLLLAWRFGKECYFWIASLSASLGLETLYFIVLHQGRESTDDGVMYGQIWRDDRTWITCLPVSWRWNVLCQICHTLIRKSYFCLLYSSYYYYKWCH